jgi:hypothetical protein
MAAVIRTSSTFQLLVRNEFPERSEELHSKRKISSEIKSEILVQSCYENQEYQLLSRTLHMKCTIWRLPFQKKDIQWDQIRHFATKLLRKQEYQLHQLNFAHEVYNLKNSIPKARSLVRLNPTFWYKIAEKTRVPTFTSWTLHMKYIISHSMCVCKHMHPPHFNTLEVSKFSVWNFYSYWWENLFFVFWWRSEMRFHWRVDKGWSLEPPLSLGMWPSDARMQVLSHFLCCTLQTPSSTYCKYHSSPSPLFLLDIDAESERVG